MYKNNHIAFYTEAPSYVTLLIYTFFTCKIRIWRCDFLPSRIEPSICISIKYIYRRHGRRLNFRSPPPPPQPGRAITDTEAQTSQHVDTRSDQEVGSRTRARRPSTIYLPMANLGASSRSIQETSTICRICLEKDREIVFMPCGHLISCRECGAKLDNCAICRKQIYMYVRAFMS